MPSQRSPRRRALRPPPRVQSRTPISRLLEIMSILRSPQGCPWDREQSHRSIRFHAVEEVYEMIDAIDSRNDEELAEELGDLLLQVVFHCQLASERKAFNFEQVARRIVDKLLRRHPHVFGNVKVRDVDAVWAQWEKIKVGEKRGASSERSSALDGIPRHLPALLRAQKLLKKARKAKLLPPGKNTPEGPGSARDATQLLWKLVERAQVKGWNLEDLLRLETDRQERNMRKQEMAVSSLSRD